MSTEELEKQLEAAEGLPDRLLNELKQESGRMPRLYQHRDGMFWPQLTLQDEELSAAGTSVFRKGELKEYHGWVLLEINRVKSKGVALVLKRSIS